VCDGNRGASGKSPKTRYPDSLTSCPDSLPRTGRRVSTTNRRGVFAAFEAAWIKAFLRGADLALVSRLFFFCFGRDLLDKLCFSKGIFFTVGGVTGGKVLL
jgi:hypothetical protein